MIALKTCDDDLPHFCEFSLPSNICSFMSSIIQNFGCKSVCLRGGLNVCHPEEELGRAFLMDKSDLPIGWISDLESRCQASQTMLRASESVESIE
jgi:hypothetical protein